jgi:hypothetical protein
MANNPETPQNSISTETTATGKKEPGKQKDFWIGFGGSIGGNLLMYGVIYGLGNGVDYVLRSIFTALKINQITGIFSLILGCLPWVANIVAIILLLKYKRPRIVLGILASYAIPILAGLVFAAYCFVSLANS